MINNDNKIYLYTKFERFWHWAQALFVIALIVTGFDLHGSFHFINFQTTVTWHNNLGIAWLILFSFIIFWEFTTGECKQYIPTTKKLITVVNYYMFGIFKGENHPVPKTKDKKHNPLQRLSYLGVAVALVPLQMSTGFLYYTYNSWPEWGINFNLEIVAFLHTAGAFALIIFLIIHVYMTTTGHSPLAHIKAMITGWEEI